LKKETTFIYRQNLGVFPQVSLLLLNTKSY